MRTKTKKYNVILLSTLCAATLAAGFGVSKSMWVASAEGYTTQNLTMSKGASIYLDQNVSGIRYDYTTNYDASLKYGMLIVPYDYLTTASIATDGSVDYINALEDADKNAIVAKDLLPNGYTRESMPANGTQVTFAHAIGELYTFNYDRKFFGIGFTEDASGNYQYAVNNENVRSVMYVASAALNAHNLQTADHTDDLETLSSLVSTGVNNVKTDFTYTLTGVEEMYIGDAAQTFTLDKAVSGLREVDLPVIWKSQDTAVASVENGVVTPLSAGTTTISATTYYGDGVSYTDSVTLEVKREPVEHFVSTVEALDENSTREDLETAYSLYVEIPEAKKTETEVVNAKATLWGLIPAKLDNGYVDYSSAMAVAYNANGWYNAQDNSTTLATHGSDAVFKHEEKTNALQYTYNSDVSFADDSGVLNVSGPECYYEHGYDNLYLHELISDGTVGDVVGFYMRATNGVNRYYDVSPNNEWGTSGNGSNGGDPSAYAVSNSVHAYYYDGYMSEDNAWTFVSAPVVTVSSGTKGVVYIEIWNNRTGTDAQTEVGGALELQFTSVYKVTAAYVDELIDKWTAETDETKKAEYERKVRDFYGALSDTEKGNVTKYYAIFNADVAKLTAQSTDDELLVLLNTYKGMSDGQKALATGYATLASMIEDRLDSSAYVDYGSALAVAYNANDQIIGVEDGNSADDVPTSGATNIPILTDRLTFSYDNATNFADASGSLKVTMSGDEWLGWGTEFGGKKYSHLYLHNIVEGGTAGDVVGFYVKAERERNYKVTNKNDDAQGYYTDGKLNTSWTFVKATLDANGNAYLKIWDGNNSTDCWTQLSYAVGLSFTSVYAITADYVESLITAWNATSDATKKAEYATKITDFYGALSDTEKGNVSNYNLFNAS